jgi:hypothetical protein
MDVPLFCVFDNGTEPVQAPERLPDLAISTPHVARRAATGTATLRPSLIIVKRHKTSTLINPAQRTPQHKMFLRTWLYCTLPRCYAHGQTGFGYASRDQASNQWGLGFQKLTVGAIPLSGQARGGQRACF